MDFAMPFMIQTFREYHDNLAELRKKFDDKEKEAADAAAAAQKAKEEQGGADPNMGMGMYNPMGQTMLAIAAPGQYMQAGYGAPMGGQMNGYGY
jgi:hypothetical protein